MMDEIVNVQAADRSGALPEQAKSFVSWILVLKSREERILRRISC
jgi:hypothetical protein